MIVFYNLFLDDLNMTHQHCVLSGMQSRYSSTHRVAEVRLDVKPFWLYLYSVIDVFFF